MKFKTAFLFKIILASLVATLILSCCPKGFFKHLELISSNLLFQIRGDRAFDKNIIIIEITDSDIAKVGHWPWKRSWHASMAVALTKLGAKAIYFDVLFPEPSVEEEDKVFEEAIKFSKKIYLPFAFSQAPYDIEKATLPIKSFLGNVKGEGSINISPDIDGTFRRIPLLFEAEDKTYPHIALKIAEDYLGLETKEIKPDYILLANFDKTVKIPLVAKNTMLINWQGKWGKTFKHYSFLDVLAAYKDFRDGQRAAIDLNNFKDSICIIALTAMGLTDIKSCPLEPEYPGVGILATAASNILDKDFLYTPPYWVNILLLYLMCLIPAFFIVGEKPLREATVVTLISITYFFIVFFLFKNRLVVNLSSPLLGLVASSMAVGTFSFVTLSVEKQRLFKVSITDSLTSLYNIGYFKTVLKNEIMLTKPDPSRQFCIVMTDVDHFKKFNDTYGHQVGDLVLKEVASVLKISVRSSDIVARYGGEEMIVLLRGVGLKDALTAAEKIRKNVEERTVSDEKNTYKVTISLGVSRFKSADDVDTVIKRADNGLYMAKESGRNRVCSQDQE